MGIAPESLKLLHKARSDEDLVGLTRAGDHAAFDELTVRYRDRIYTLAMLSLGDEDVAADAVCETFLSAYRDVDSVGGGCAPRTWIYLHALRAVFSRVREVGAA